MAFANGDAVEPLTVIGKVGQKNTGTQVTFGRMPASLTRPNMRSKRSNIYYEPRRFCALA